MAPPLTQTEIDQRVFDLYDEYCHGPSIGASSFTAQVFTVGGVSALAMAQALPRHALAQTISFTDRGSRPERHLPVARRHLRRRGYLVQPSTQGPFPVVLVIHENRGLNPYIEDVARRAATEGSRVRPRRPIAVGGYPGSDDEGRTLRGWAQSASCAGMVNGALPQGARSVHRQARSRRVLLGGSTTNFLAVTLGGDLQAGVPFYGAAAETAESSIKAPLLIQYAENDERINTLWPCLRGGAEGERRPVRDAHVSRNPAAPQQLDAALPRGVGKARLERTIAFFKKNLGALA